MGKKRPFGIHSRRVFFCPFFGRLRERLIMTYILARVQIDGPVPMVVSVQTYSEPSPCLDYSRYRWWLLATIKPEEKPLPKESVVWEAIERLKEEGHAWACPFMAGDIKIPHTGR